MSIIAVVNTCNEERNITRCLKSVARYVDEIVVVDMHSVDRTVELARKFTDKVWSYPFVSYVEPARNYAIGKAKGDWIFLIDADEVLPPSLGEKLRQLVTVSDYSFYRIPRRNFIFGHTLNYSGWWPDYQIRFFQKGTVIWNDEIHSIPMTSGKGMDLPRDDKNALIHYHYETVSQYLERMNRYTNQEATQLVTDGYEFKWVNLLTKPAGEFLTRFFAWEGYKDGLHGLVLSLLQSISYFVVELKVWERNEFKIYKQTQFPEEVGSIIGGINRDFTFWYFRAAAQNTAGLIKLVYRVRQVLRI